MRRPQPGMRGRVFQRVRQTARRDGWRTGFAGSPEGLPLDLIGS